MGLPSSIRLDHAAGIMIDKPKMPLSPRRNGSGYSKCHCMISNAKRVVITMKHF
jgi:hypothetical protein